MTVLLQWCFRKFRSRACKDAPEFWLIMMISFCSFAFRQLPLLVLFFAITGGVAYAQNTGGVSGPVVRDGSRVLDYRFAFVPGEDGRDDRLAHRVQGTFAVGEKRQWRLIAQARDRGGPDGLEYDYLKTEVWWEFSDETETRWHSALRFGGAIRNGSAPDAVGVDWLNQFTLSERLSARTNLHTLKQLGDRAADGILLQARASLTYRLENNLDVSLLGFHALGSTQDFGLEDRPQQAGPTISGRFGGGWGWTVGSLFGLNDDTPDHDFRLWISRAL